MVLVESKQLFHIKLCPGGKYPPKACQTFFLPVDGRVHGGVGGGGWRGEDALRRQREVRQRRRGSVDLAAAARAGGVAVGPRAEGRDGPRRGGPGRAVREGPGAELGCNSIGILGTFPDLFLTTIGVQTHF